MGRRGNGSEIDRNVEHEIGNGLKEEERGEIDKNVKQERGNGVKYIEMWSKRGKGYRVGDGEGRVG
jgi:hypothetical protein